MAEPTATSAAAAQEKKPSQQRACFQDQLRKTKLCVYHLKGTCKNGWSCSYAHAEQELQNAPDLRKTRLCKAFAAGSCTNKSCTYAHSADELRSSEMFFKKTLCIWHARDKCRNGDQCRFAHGSVELQRYRNWPNCPVAEPNRKSGHVNANNATAGKRPSKQSAPPHQAGTPLTSLPSPISRSFDNEPMKIQTGSYPPKLQAAEASDVAYAVAAEAIKTHLDGLNALTGADMHSHAAKEWISEDLNRLRQAMSLLSAHMTYPPQTPQSVAHSMDSGKQSLWGSTTTAGFEGTRTPGSGSGSSSDSDMRMVESGSPGSPSGRELAARYADMPWSIPPPMPPPGVGANAGSVMAMQAAHMKI
eukprot:CAMPEP_0178437672 /NCGR_PEP_ID=MMETSP0689_2-20121128/35138_1 /TAXON_ID=160604 /ORGANISM="Amphidinium massartii, Strain CS-259" /LENGTH=359 /DNA_ID=CAMNT_0020059931 /DNA_START=53 /DNA_END=1132 /DNA_ORIENTATION=+